MDCDHVLTGMKMVTHIWVSKNNFYAFTHLQDGATALFYTSQEGHLEVVHVLLRSGAQDIPTKVCTHLTMYVVTLSLYLAL